MLLADIAEKIRTHSRAIEAWFDGHEKSLAHPLFLSCDIRHSGDKVAVIDANLFPAGFNNLCSTYTQQAIAACKAALGKRFPGTSRILLVSESHTRNKFYFENIWHLSKILEGAGFVVRIAMIDPTFDDILHVELSDEKRIHIYPITARTLAKHRISWSDFDPELIISNNDFSTPPPEQWQGLLQPIIPLPSLGWWRRRKSAHFQFSATLIHEFAALIGCEAWQLSCRFDSAHALDLNQAAAVKALADKTKTLLATLKADHDRYGIAREPYLFLKSDSGTYGMAVSTVHSAEDIEQLNRKMRNKLLSSKSGVANSDFLLQEGIPTDDFYSEQPIEPVIYLIGGRFVGGFFRLNPLRDAYSSLNSAGMQFSCLCLHKLDEPHEWPFIECSEKQELVFVAIYLARIASLAAGMEAK